MAVLFHDEDGGVTRRFAGGGTDGVLEEVLVWVLVAVLVRVLVEALMRYWWGCSWRYW